MAKDELKQKAQKHNQKMEECYMPDIKRSVANTKVYSANIDTSISDCKPFACTSISVVPVGTVEAIFRIKTCTPCVLNFASYKNPGGKFLDGSMAQEEALCHSSNLYSILSRFQNIFYRPHLKSLNNGAYTDELLYSKDVLFFADAENKYADVITCAAPNNSCALKYNQDLIPKMEEAMLSRINHLLYAAVKSSDRKCLILGAFGCGVFANDPVFVARAFKQALNTKYKNMFETVIFAVPNSNAKNYNAFKAVF